VWDVDEHDSKENALKLRRQECRRLLLDAGADPLLQCQRFLNEGSPFEMALLGATSVSLVNTVKESVVDLSKESLRILIDLGGEFIDLHQRDRLGRTPLLSMIVNAVSINPCHIRLLLMRGADIHARDNAGNTCLHLLVSSARNPNGLWERDSLMLLIFGMHADVLAVNNRGKTVSELAYTPNSRDRKYMLGNYRGDLWDTVLVACGYNLPYFRNNFPRTPRKTKYPPTDIEKLRKFDGFWTEYGIPAEINVEIAMEQHLNAEEPGGGDWSDTDVGRVSQTEDKQWDDVEEPQENEHERKENLQMEALKEEQDHEDQYGDKAGEEAEEGRLDSEEESAEDSESKEEWGVEQGELLDEEEVYDEEEGIDTPPIFAMVSYFCIYNRILVKRPLN